MATKRLMVRLSGDGPWGFRIQGGTEPGIPLTIAKVRAKSKAYGLLEEGDVLVSVNGWPCEDMSYDDVVDILDSTGHELELEVTRTEDKENLAPYDDYSKQIEKQTVAMETDYSSTFQTNVPVKKSPSPAVGEPQPVEGCDGLVNGIASEPEQSAQEVNADETSRNVNTQDNAEEAGVTSDDRYSTPQEPEAVTTEPTLPERDDVVTTFHREVTPEGFTERSITRKVTSEPNVKGEVTTETLSEKHGSTELFSQRHQEYEERRSPLGGGGGIMAPGIGSMFNVSKFSSSTSKATTWSPFSGEKNSSVSKTSETVSKTTTNIFSSQQSSTSTQVTRHVISPTLKVLPKPQPPVVPQPPPPPPQQVVQEAPVIPQPPPPPPDKPQRPYSMPSLDFDILEAIEKNKITLVGSEKQKQEQKQQKQQQQQSRGFGKPFTSSPAKTRDGHTINANDEESRRFQMLMKAFQPASDDEGIITPRRRKMFASSSFYDEPQHKYPTVEEQVKLCKSIADSLSAETNKMSRGATMYLKRMNRSFNWITEGPDPTSSESEGLRDAESSEANTPDVKPGDFRPLKLVLDPRQLQDAMKLAKTGMYNEHNVVSPDICFDLVRDLNSPTGKGAQLFAKRKKKSEKWIVDENSVKEAVKEAAAKHVALQDIAASAPSYSTAAASSVPPAPSYVPANKLQEIQDRLHPRVKLVKSPWEAALESPYGSCDAAFVVTKPPPPPINPIVSSLVSAIEQKEAPPLSQPLPPLTVNTNLPSSQVDMRLLSPQPYSPAHVPLSQSMEPTRSGSPYAQKGITNIYKPKAPKGWTGFSGDQSNYTAWAGQESPNLLDTSFSSDVTEPSSFQRLRLDQFPNYNNVARVWGSSSTGKFRPVRPSSVVIGK